MELDIREYEKNLLPPADLAGEVERLQESLRAELDRNLRTLADFKNYRRRLERDNGKAAEEAKRVIILQLLDIADDMENAMKWAGDEESPFVEGVRNIHQKFLAMLESQGVTPFISVGTPFDHSLHEAVAVAPHNGREAGIVIDELRRGYRWNSGLLRHAQVRVAG
jgi:molecular chaperone GrpE